MTMTLSGGKRTGFKVGSDYYHSVKYLITKSVPTVKMIPTGRTMQICGRNAVMIYAANEIAATVSE